MGWHFVTQTRLKLLGPRTYIAQIACFIILAVCGLAQGETREFHQTFTASIAQPVSLKVELSEGDLEIGYSHDGEVSFRALAQGATAEVPADFLRNLLSITNAGNQIDIREQRSTATFPQRIKITYQIDVPYRTEVHSFLKSGKQTITGIMGPVSAEEGAGTLKVSYISKTVVAHAAAGDLDIEVIGDHVEATTGRGNIACQRLARGVKAETGDGDISLMVVGPAEAKVKQGAGRIDAGGVWGTLVASTDAGDLHVKAVARDNWQLSSVSGSIRVELPPGSGFELDAMTKAGEIVVGRDDLLKPAPGAHQLTQRANGGGKRIEARSQSGRISVS